MKRKSETGTEESTPWSHSTSFFSLTPRRMLDDLGNRVDSTSSKLQRAQRKMNDFIRRNEGE